MTNKTIDKTKVINLSCPDFLTELKGNKATMVQARSSKLSDDKVNTILDEVVNKLELKNYNEAVAMIAVLFQGGGCAKGCDGNLTIDLFEKSLKLADLRKILQDAKCKRAERKLARSLADSIQSISTTLAIDGNLYKKIVRSNLELTFTPAEKAWLSDFQQDNPNCPSHLRALIVNSFKDKKKTK